jgi:putative NIF3 family GTP cyclohydrolase 1 type 2
MQEQEKAIPVKVLEDLVRHLIRWIETHRPVDADRDGTAQWVLSAAFSSLIVSASACASLGALGGDITEEQFVGIAREAFRRARRNAPQAGAPMASA